MKAWFALHPLASLVQTARAWFTERLHAARWGERYATDTEQILNDIELSMEDMPALTHASCAPQTLLPKRMELAGLDPARLRRENPAVMRDLELTCMGCTQWRRCARDLAKGDGEDTIATYCCNSVSFGHHAARVRPQFAAYLT